MTVYVWCDKPEHQSIGIVVMEWKIIEFNESAGGFYL